MCIGGSTVRKGSMLASAAILVVVTTLGLIVIAEGRTQTGSWSWTSVGMAPVSGGYGQAVVGAGDRVYLAKCLYASSSSEFYSYPPETEVG